VVLLDSNNRFRLSETYLGKDQPCKEKCGTWTVQDGRVMLFADNAPIAQYAVSGSNLLYVDEVKQGKARAAQGVLARKKFIRSEKINEKFLEGIDVVGFGKDASWSLDITHNKAIQFSVAGLDAPVAFSPVIPTLSGDSLIYNVITANDKMQIIYAPGFCGDGENMYDYKVTVNYRGKTYNGCGAIMNADGGLDGVWIMQSFNAMEGNWNERPYLVIDLNEQKFYGFTGCNNFNGTVLLKGLKVCFTGVTQGSKECDGYNENALIETLMKCNGFSISEGTLELSQDGRTLMTLKRKSSGE
jgi:heat shock protein HslJ/uncharacterized membrane protein